MTDYLVPLRLEGGLLHVPPIGETRHLARTGDIQNATEHEMVVVRNSGEHFRAPVLIEDLGGLMLYYLRMDTLK